METARLAWDDILFILPSSLCRDSDRLPRKAIFCSFGRWGRCSARDPRLAQFRRRRAVGAHFLPDRRAVLFCKESACSS